MSAKNSNSNSAKNSTNDTTSMISEASTLNNRKSPRITTPIDYKALHECAIPRNTDMIQKMEAESYLKDIIVSIENGIGLTKSKMLHMLRSDNYFLPLFIQNKEGLGMIVPDSTLSVQEISDKIGPNNLVSVIDGESNEDAGQWSLQKWAKYYHSQDKKHIYNVISLEISRTDLGNSIKRPTIVEKSDLITNCWPKRKQKVVYYHVLSGEKVFYLIPPTSKNLRAYEQWCSSEEQFLLVFNQFVNGQVGRVVLKSGNTLIIPGGWIHAVSTLKDTIVIGGNFLMLETMGIHINVYKMESRMNVSETYRLPYFLSICEWITLNIEKNLKSIKNSKKKRK
ncbi:hypothetical protein BB561_003877 [Smittium simulii]|uniref:[histone H3]-dimethyl-L-lysine(36) demethylase n=1 Tax=Smittium simulii TaxID=133385 RepID=A0A2T9YJ55_9FUNG|nr:hypothetical protein BB561_003877 [Smittium simulii]